MEVNFKPNSDRVLIQLDETTMTAGGLHIPQTAATGMARRGTVVQVGPGRQGNYCFIEVPFSVGDRVLLDEIGGLKVVVGGKEFILARSEEILGKLED